MTRHRRRRVATTIRALVLERLEDRFCPSVVPVSLDFSKLAAGSGDTVTTSFGSITLTGFPESSIIDSDLVKAGFGTVLENVPNSNYIGYGEISLQGALGVSISFDYGTRGDQQGPDKGGFTGFTYTQSEADNQSGPPSASGPNYAPAQPPPNDVFKLFNLNEGQPIGPETLYGPGLGSSTAGYFNNFQWTSGTYAGNVFDVSRSGASQIANVQLMVEPVQDIFDGSKISVEDSTTNPKKIAPGGIVATWTPIGKYPVNLTDLAAAAGFTGFNWVSTVVSDPMPLPDKNGNVPPKNPDGTYKPYIDPPPGGYLGKATDDTEPYYWNVPGFQGGNPGDNVTAHIGPTASEPEPIASTIGLPNSLGLDGDTLDFVDQPSTPNIATKFPGQKVYFITQLVGVRPNGIYEPLQAFSWSSDYDATAGKGNATSTGYRSTLIGEAGDSGTGGVTIINPDLSLAEIPPDVLSLWASDGADLSQAPVQAEDDSATTAPGTPVAIPVLMNDLGPVNPGSVTIGSSPADGSVVVDPATGIVTYSPAAGFTGTDTFQYTVAGQDGAVSNAATVTITVQPVVVNHPPTLSAIPAQAATEGHALSFTAQASDPDAGQTLTYSLDPGAPIGATIDPTTGVFTWTPTDAQAGQAYDFGVRVADSGTPALHVDQPVTIDVAYGLAVVAVSDLTPPDPGPMQIAVDFNEPLEPASAETITNYRVVSDANSSLPIQSAAYSDSGTLHWVVLTIAAGTAVVPDAYHVYVDAANLTATNGDHAAPKGDQLWVDVTSENTLKPITVQPDGSFGVSAASEFLGYAPPLQIVAGDFTGNGNTDLVMITSGKHEEILNGNDTLVYDPVLLLKSNGDGTYAAPVPIALGGQYQAVSLSSVDWNHDGVPDLVVGVASNFDEYVHPQTEQFYVLLNDGHGNFTNAPETPIPVADPQSDYLGANGISPFQAVGFEDLAGSGSLDIVHLGQLVGNPGSDFGNVGDFDLEVIGKDQYVGYTPQMELPLGVNSGLEVTPNQILFADLNGDGKPDIITRDFADYQSFGDFSVILSTPTGYATGVTYRNSLALNDAGNPLSDPVALGVGHFTGSGYNDVAAIYGGDIEIY